jgi:hypothetical protein
MTQRLIASVKPRLRIIQFNTSNRWSCQTRIMYAQGQTAEEAYSRWYMKMIDAGLSFPIIVDPPTRWVNGVCVG